MKKLLNNISDVEIDLISFISSSIYKGYWDYILNNFKLENNDINTNFIKFILKYINIKNKSNGLPILYSEFINKFNKSLLNLLINSGLNILEVDNDNNSFLIESIYYNNPKLALTLIELGLDVNHKNSFGNSPIIFAIHNDYIDVLISLIEYGAEINIICENKTPLIHAIAKNKINCVEILLKYNADVNLKDIHNRTPIYYASECGRFDIVRLLIEYGADVNTSNYSHALSRLNI